MAKKKQCGRQEISQLSEDIAYILKKPKATQQSECGGTAVQEGIPTEGG